jgi:Flp pilus assembly protein TadD
MVALLREEHEKAAALWRKAAALDPTLPGVHYHLAQALAAMGESGEAIAVLKKDVQDSAKAGQGHWLLGQLYVQLKEYEKAKNSYQTALQLQPDHAKAYYGLAVLSARLGQSDQARRYMDRFKQLKTRDVKLDKGRRSTYDDLEVMRAQVAGTYSDVGTVYAAHGNLPEAEQLWRKAAILDPGNTACRTNLATLYQRNRRQREAVEICEQLRALEPDNPVRYLNLGILRARLRQFDAAEQALRKACELAPRRSDGYRLLAQIRLDRNEGGAETMELARQAVRLEPIAPNYFVLGAACAKNGDLAGARSALQRAMALDPGNPKYRRTYELFQGN